MLVAGAVLIAIVALVFAGRAVLDDDPTGEVGRVDRATEIPAPRSEAPNASGQPQSLQVPPAPQPDGEAAVRVFLNSEIAGDYAGSFSVLSDRDRSRVGGPDLWLAQHAELPGYRDFIVVDVEDERVTTEVTFEPRLDEIVGFVPARATVEWRVVSEEGGFLVDLDDTSVRPVIPADDGASAVAVDWAQAAAAGDATEDLEYGGSLLGQSDIAERIRSIADQDGTSPGYRSASVSELGDWDHPEVVTNAFGPGAGEWARVVRLDGPAPLDVVTAPLGDRWVVVGVVAV
jgi:hypothetical protein